MMPWCAFIGGVAGWVYLGLVAWRWDRYRYGLALPDNFEPLFIGCLFLWCLVFLGQEERPPRPWLAWEPRSARPTASERLAAAERRSLELERKAGLEFNGIFLLPGYREEGRRA